MRFHADGQSGTATITAFSGGASGKLENLRVGIGRRRTHSPDASPQSYSLFGRPISWISARVEDVSGVGLPQVPVVFTTTRGTLNPSNATTDASGNAVTTLSTSQEATVTANAAGKTATATVTLSPRTGIAITSSDGRSVGWNCDEFYGGGSQHSEYQQRCTELRRQKSSENARANQRFHNSSSYFRRRGYLHRQRNCD